MKIPVPRAPVRRVPPTAPPLHRGLEVRWLWSKLVDSFWVLPLVCAGVAAALALGLSTVDESLDTSVRWPLLFAGGPEGARSLLAAIITSMISFTGLVFSITIVVLQLTSSQFSPRVLRTFLRDRFNQLTLGIFVATFVYALVVLRAVRGTSQVDPFVPQLAVTVAFGFVLASVAVFLAYINHIAQSIRAATIISRIAAETRELLERRHPKDGAEVVAGVPRGGEVRRVAAAEPGVIQRVDVEALGRVAAQHNVTVQLLRAVGEFVPAGAPLLDVYGSGQPEARQLLRAVLLGRERSMDEDVGFGLRQLVDIAERALSPGVNDPTTAVQVLDQLHDLLRRMATRRLVPRQGTGEDGRVLVDVPQPAFGQYLGLAVDEIAHWGRDDQRVRRRVGVLLRDLHHAALEEHRADLAHALIRYGQGATATPVQPEPSDIGLRSDRSTLKR